MSQSYQHAIFCAMYCEVEWFERFFDLKKIQSHPYEIFANDELLFIISGVGGVCMTKAAHYIIQKYTFEHVWNIGICGGEESAKHKIFSPSVLRMNGCKNIFPEITESLSLLPLEMVQSVETNVIKEGLVDMESYDFYGYFSNIMPLQSIHMIKVVSDSSGEILRGESISPLFDLHKHYLSSLFFSVATHRRILKFDISLLPLCHFTFQQERAFQKLCRQLFFIHEDVLQYIQSEYSCFQKEGGQNKKQNTKDFMRILEKSLNK
ncbi:hypothetical protein COB57_00630 [Candidatus Peregrinibacteria bacterium]|nr:MAG: hypothetical protein COB57_00630 [Candidatus Peregrinibacteria bacterium]